MNLKLFTNFKIFIENVSKILIILSTFTCLNIYGQEFKSDSTKDKGEKILKSTNPNSSLVFDDLLQTFDKYYTAKDTSSASVITQYYVKLSKKRRDTLRLAQGLHLTSMLRSSEVAVQYYDTIIALTGNSIIYDEYPSLAYMAKAHYYYRNKDFEQALENYLLSSQSAKLSGNSRLVNENRYHIGNLKNRIGDFSEALTIFKEHLKRQDSMFYLNTVFSITSAYYRLNKLDSASKYNNIGLSRSIVSKDNIFQNYFLLTAGVISSLKEEYDISTKNLLEALPYMEENHSSNAGTSYYYLGRNAIEEKKYDKGMDYLLKFDSIYLKTKDLLPETRKGYEYIIDYYKSKDDLVNQLKYIKRLVEVDSILFSNYRFLNKTINNRYDKPQLIEDKQRIIESLKKKEYDTEVKITVISILFVLSLLFGFTNYRKQMINKRKFRELIKSTSTEKNSIKRETNKIDANPLSKDVKINIEKNLKGFIYKKEYLDGNITATNLAKKFNTNAKYLANFIKSEYKMTFINYINDLRISYVLNELKQNKKLRKQTILAIANSVGFGTAESFTRAFYKKTGLKPSYVIKNLEKSKDQKIK